jgi:DNA polymerase III alpha subunit
MENFINTSKSVLLDMAAYKLPNVRIARIFDTVPKIIRETGFNMFDYQKVFNDEPTKKLIREGLTIGCFYIESPGMRSLLKRLNCDTFEMLTAASSVIRPGVAESGMMKEFILRHKNPKLRKYFVPEMEKYLGETYGVMIYQEDVIKVAYHIVGLSLEESDLLRRAMSGKMRSHKAMQMIIDKFFVCCKAKGYTDDTSRKLWKQIESFAGYAFCKAHSASFAIFSFQVAYLKAHYPAEFLAGVLSNGGGYYSSAVYISECRRLGIKVLLPSVNESDYEYRGNYNIIKIGLMAIKNFEKESSGTIIRERTRNGKFVSLNDILERTNLSFTQAEILIKCGAMDCFGQTRPAMLRLIDIYFHNKILLDNGNGYLFADEMLQMEKEALTNKQFSIEEICVNEYEALGYMVTKHPLEFFTDEIGAGGIVKSPDMIKYNNRKVKMIGWYMASKRIQTSKGEVMKFLSLEDIYGTFEAVLFPKTYQTYAELTLSMGPYLVEGRVDMENGGNIIVEKLSVLATEKAKSITQKDRTGSSYFGDPEKPANYDELLLVSSLDSEKLIQAYLG